MAVVWLSGFEHGLGNANGTGLQLATPASANANVVTTAGRVKSGTYAQRLNPAAAAIGVRGFHNLAAAGVCNGGFWMLLENLPTGDAQLFTVQGATTEDAVIQFDQGTGKLAAFDPANGQRGIWNSCPVLAADTWYWIAWKVDRTADSMSLTITPDGGSPVDCGSISGIAWTANNGWVAIGNDAAQTVAIDVFYDDLIICSGGTEYPLGPHEILAVSPGSDGTHSFTANDFSTGDTGTQQAPSFTTFFQMVDDPPPFATARSTTDNIAQRVIRTTGYVEIKAAATLAGKPTATAVRALLAYSSTATTADNGACIARNSAGFAGVIWGDLPVAQGGNGGALADYSENPSNFFKGAIVTAPGAGWTKTELDAIRWRLGGSGDITPVPTWQQLLLEIAYPLVTTPAASGTSSVRGGGILTAAASKGGTAVSTARGGGILTASARKAAATVSTVRGGGIVVSTGQKDAAPARSGTSSVQGGGSVASSVKKAAAGTSSARGGGSLTATSRKAGAGTSSVRGGGGSVGVGREGALRITAVSGGGSVASTGRKNAAGTSAVRGGGFVTSVGTQLIARSGSSTVRGGGSVTSKVSKNGTQSSSVRGGGSVTSSGFAPPLRFGTSTVRGGGALIASARGGRTSTSRVTAGGSLVALGKTARSATSSVRGGGIITSTSIAGQPAGPPVTWKTSAGNGSGATSSSTSPGTTRTSTGSGVTLSGVQSGRTRRGGA